MSKTFIPKISVVITAYNSAAYIGQAIQSVLTQTRPVDEIVVVDDGSIDETAAIVAAYAPSGVRLVWQENQGAGAARNRGIAATSGDLLTFLDGDDVWLPEKTEWQLDYLQSHPAAAMVSGYKWWWDARSGERKLVTYGVRPPARLDREVLIRNVVGNPSMALLRRSILAEVGLFEPGLRWGQDWELWIRIATRAEIGFIPRPVIFYRWHPDNLSHYRRWDRLDCLFGISRRAIRHSRPAWRRPLLLARAWSQTELDRALYTIKRSFPRRQQIRHAGQALLAYPFENSAEKLKAFWRVTVGENFYQRLKAAPGLARLRQERP